MWRWPPWVNGWRLRQCVWASCGIWLSSWLKSPPRSKNSLNTAQVGVSRSCRGRRCGELLTKDTRWAHETVTSCWGAFHVWGLKLFHSSLVIVITLLERTRSSNKFFGKGRRQRPYNSDHTEGPFSSWQTLLEYPESGMSIVHVIMIYYKIQGLSKSMWFSGACPVHNTCTLTFLKCLFHTHLHNCSQW